MEINYFVEGYTESRGSNPTRISCGAVTLCPYAAEYIT